MLRLRFRFLPSVGSVQHPNQTKGERRASARSRLLHVYSIQPALGPKVKLWFQALVGSLGPAENQSFTLALLTGCTLSYSGLTVILKIFGISETKRNDYDERHINGHTAVPAPIKYSRFP